MRLLKGKDEFQITTKPSLTNLPEAVVTGLAVASAVLGVLTAISTVFGRDDC